MRYPTNLTTLFTAIFFTCFAGVALAEEVALKEFRTQARHAEKSLEAAQMAIRVESVLLSGDVAYTMFEAGRPVLVVDREFLEEAPSLVLKHVVYHEACHVRLGHHGKGILRKGPTRFKKEVLAERCVEDEVGKEEYEEMIRSLKTWVPQDPELREVVSKAVQFFDKLYAQNH